MTKILFVCHGNICRSPMAEFILKDLVRKAGCAAEVRIASAATSREELGSPFDDHRARQMTRADYDAYDLLIGMDSRNLANMRRICGGDPDGKLQLLLHYTGQTHDVADPWYTDDFDAAWRDIESGCRALLAQLKK